MKTRVVLKDHWCYFSVNNLTLLQFVTHFVTFAILKILYTLSIATKLRLTAIRLYKAPVRLYWRGFLYYVL